MEIDKENERQDCNNDDLTIKRRSSILKAKDDTTKIQTQTAVMKRRVSFHNLRRVQEFDRDNCDLNKEAQEEPLHLTSNSDGIPSDPMSTTFVTGANFVDDNATMTLTLLQDPQAMSTPVIGERTTRFSRRLSTAHKNDENTTMHVFSNVETETVSGTIPQQQGMQHRSQANELKFTDQTFAVFNNLGDDGQLKGTSLGKKPSPCRKSPSRSPRPRAIGATGGCEADFIGLTQAIFANVENGTNLPDHTVVLTPTHQKGLAINRSPMPEEGSFTRAILDAAVTPKAADVEVPRDQVNSKSVVSSPSFEFSSGSFNLVPKRATPKKQAAVPRQLQQSFDFSDIQSQPSPSPSLGRSMSIFQEKDNSAVAAGGGDNIITANFSIIDNNDDSGYRLENSLTPLKSMVLENIITTPTVLKDKDNEKQQPLHETSRWSQAYHDSSTKMSKMSLVEAEIKPVESCTQDAIEVADVEMEVDANDRVDIDNRGNDVENRGGEVDNRGDIDEHLTTLQPTSVTFNIFGDSIMAHSNVLFSVSNVSRRMLNDTAHTKPGFFNEPTEDEPSALGKMTMSFSEAAANRANVTQQQKRAGAGTNDVEISLAPKTANTIESPTCSGSINRSLTCSSNVTATLRKSLGRRRRSIALEQQLHRRSINVVPSLAAHLNVTSPASLSIEKNTSGGSVASTADLFDENGAPLIEVSESDLNETFQLHQRKQRLYAFMEEMFERARASEEDEKRLDDELSAAFDQTIARIDAIGLTVVNK